MKQERIKLSALEQNLGQMEGLPENPRQWTREELTALEQSIRETPELLDARGLIVYPMGKKYIILGGNMRYAALAEMGAKDAPCYVVPEGTDMEKLKEFVLKDNGSFGEWDWTELDAKWGDKGQLERWNVKQVNWAQAPVFGGGAAQPEDSHAAGPGASREPGEKKPLDLSGLPEELQGTDITPDETEDYKGEDIVARERIVITFDENSAWKLNDLFGVEMTSRVLWRLEEIMQLRNK